MATFAERQSELGLKKFLDSPRGTMFLADDSQVVDQDGFVVRPLVRRLDGFITPALVEVYAEMVEASDRWVAHHPDLDHDHWAVQLPAHCVRHLRLRVARPDEPRSAGEQRLAALTRREHHDTS